MIAEKEASQLMEDNAAESRSQLSQSLIGAHLVDNKDFYPFHGGSAFQTPKPLKDELGGNMATV